MPLPVTEEIGFRKKSQSSNLLKFGPSASVSGEQVAIGGGGASGLDDPDHIRPLSYRDPKPVRTIRTVFAATRRSSQGEKFFM